MAKAPTSPSDKSTAPKLGGAAKSTGTTKAPAPAKSTAVPPSKAPAAASASAKAKKPRPRGNKPPQDLIIPRRREGHPIKLVERTPRKSGDPMPPLERFLRDPFELVNILRQRPPWADDLAAILLIAFGFVTLLTLLNNPNVASMALSDRWADFIGQIFGRFGAIVLSFLVICGGFLIVLQRVNIPIYLSWRRVLAVEVGFMALLAMLHLLARDGEPRALARAGGGGGYVGWALSEIMVKLFGPGISLLFYFAIFVAAIVAMIGIRKAQARKWLAAASKQMDALSAELKRRAADFAKSRPRPAHWAAPLSGGKLGGERELGHAVPLNANSLQPGAVPPPAERTVASSPMATPLRPDMGGAPAPLRPAPAPAAAEALGKSGKTRRTGLTPAASTATPSGFQPALDAKRAVTEMETIPTAPPLTPQPIVPAQPPPLQKPAASIVQPPGKKRTTGPLPITPPDEAAEPAVRAPQRPPPSKPPTRLSPIVSPAAREPMDADAAEPPVPATIAPLTPMVAAMSAPRETAKPTFERRTRYFTVEDFKENRRVLPRPGLPPMTLLDDTELNKPTENEINGNARIIENTLLEFDVDVEVVDVKVGPTVTQYAVQPFRELTSEQGTQVTQRVRVTKIQSLTNDLALALAAKRLRIQPFVPGHSYMGIEVPNRTPAIVALRPVMESETFARAFVKPDPDTGRDRDLPLTVPLGRDVAGEAVVVDLATMPHMLIAGTTGSGKSVCITAMIVALVMNNLPDRLKLVMLDPKMVELTRFNGLPHMLGPVETDIERIIGVLRWATREMDRRYKLLETAATRNIEAYNRSLGEARKAEQLPYMVIFVDEIGDLMLSRPEEMERTVTRLAQMARAVGIHLVIATQRPSTDIITGLIKANFPARISFAVTSGVDSRVILDNVGAETLVGRGDMLYLAPDAGAPRRVQGCFVADVEIDAIMEYWKQWAAGKPREAYEIPWERAITRREALSDTDPMLEEAIDLVVQAGEASTSMIQKQLNIPYPRAAQLMDLLNELGILGAIRADGRTRDVTLKPGTDPYKKLMAKYKR